jgi:hypothetical protein
MSTPFQAITTGDKTIAERVSAPIRAVKSDFQQRRKTAEAGYDALNIDYMGLPDNQVQMAQAWGDAVRENLIEGYRTNNQDLIRDAKQQGRNLTSYITAMQQDYAIGRNSMKRAEQKQFRDLSNSKEEIMMGFDNRYKAPIGFEVDERGYPKGISIDGQPVAIGQFVNSMKDNPFMVVDAVDFGAGFRAEKNAARHNNEIIAAGSLNGAKEQAVKYAEIDIENGLVSNEDLAVLYANRNKLISDVNNPSEKDVQLIQSIAQDPKKLEEAKSMYVNDYSNYLGDQYTTREKAKAKQERETQEKVAANGILAINPVVADLGEGIGKSAIYYTDVEGVSFDIKGNERVQAVGISEGGDINYVKVMVKVPSMMPPYYTYEDKVYAGEELTTEVSQLVRNRIEVKAPKQINGFNRFVDKAKKEIQTGTPNEQAAVEALSKPADS